MRAAALLCLGLAACQSCPSVTPAERVVTQTVRVPVPVVRTPPPELLGCRAAAPPPPQFADSAGGLLLPSAGIDQLLAWSAALRRCDDAWRAWATSQ